MCHTIGRGHRLTSVNCQICEWLGRIMLQLHWRRSGRRLVVAERIQCAQNSCPSNAMLLDNQIHTIHRICSITIVLWHPFLSLSWPTYCGIRFDVPFYFSFHFSDVFCSPCHLVCISFFLVYILYFILLYLCFLGYYHRHTRTFLPTSLV